MIPAALQHAVFRRLFGAQLIALTGTGLATVALGLLALQLAGDRAGVVLGTALAIKMTTYVFLSPLAAALAERLPRRSFLIGLDLIRASVMLCLPFVDQLWQIYVLIFLLQAASAGFTPAFQAVIPDVLPNDRSYTSALSLMRIAEDAEQIISPLLAVLLLGFVGFSDLFIGTAIGFACSAWLIAVTPIAAKSRPTDANFWGRARTGVQIYTRTPRLRGLLALEAAVAAAGAMVFVNTASLAAQFAPQDTGRAIALAMGAFGAGSIAAAALAPSLRRFADRWVMISGAAIMTLGLICLPWMTAHLLSVMLIWAVMGAGFSLNQTPIGRVLTQSCAQDDRTATFAAQFALSHLFWLFTYPLAGLLGAAVGLQITALVLAGIALVGLFAGALLWPAQDIAILAHDHADLPPDHPHIAQHIAPAAHGHVFVIDVLHPRWPNSAGRL